ncbi:MAG TPA: ABC transporter permease [Ramlibacter sp.]|uniref:ABC transporter permease n=1 Tax=Ramlibacter sp. TaxID=1917967 RepID=UPI002CD2726A|nr:ABC transporter permease [Ramlibacter sp.]HVZ45959.1 ABC transporter permease [Ramlibacter sp.]
MNSPSNTASALTSASASATPSASTVVPSAATNSGGKPRKAPIPSIVISVAAVAALCALWTIVSTSGWIPAGYLPTPMELWRDGATLVNDGYKDVSLLAHVKISLMRTLAGFGLGILFGVPLGLWTGYSRVGNAIASPIMAFIRPIPPIAFIPMVVLYFGLGELGKVVLIFWTSFNYVHVNAHAGAANVPIAYLRAARSLGMTPSQLFTNVVFPAAIPQIFTGLKVALALSWAVVVAAELTGAQSGLGYMIADAALTFRIPTVFIGIALIGAIGLGLNLVLNFIEARIVHWRGR